MKKTVKDSILTAVILISAFFISVIFQEIMGIEEHISTLFAFAVFLISMLTKGYVYGIVSAFLGTLAINYAFTFPYFAFNFTIPVNLVSAIVMVTIALLTGALTTQIKHHQVLKSESEKERMRANLLRAVSHDIRTPLTTIYGSATTLIENGDTLTEEQKTKMLVGIKEDSVWLVRIVENLLSVTKIDSDNVKLIKTPIVLDELIDAVLLKFKKIDSAVPVTVSLPEEIVIIPMDALLVEQVLVNLLENAVRHAGDITRLELRVTVENAVAIFEIEDDGCGIDPEKIEQYFEGYYVTEDAPADSQKKNAGIGLSVCATIVKAHGGEISAENLPDGGALFRFTLKTEENACE